MPCVFIRDDLARRIQRGVVATGAMSDPYNPFEAEQQLTRHALELINAYGYGVAIATKCDLVCRDIDVLQEIKRQSPVLCKLTITSFDDDLAAKLEPRAPSPSRRFAALRQLADAGLFCGVLLMPVLPYVNDTEENILAVTRMAYECGARWVYPYFGVTMREGQREYFLHELDTAFPGEYYAQQYRSRFGNHYHCPSPAARRLYAAFEAECAATGLLHKMQDIVAAYRQGYGSTQLSFL